MGKTPPICSGQMADSRAEAGNTQDEPRASSESTAGLKGQKGGDMLKEQPETAPESQGWNNLSKKEIHNVILDFNPK